MNEAPPSLPAKPIPWLGRRCLRMGWASDGTGTVLPIHKQDVFQILMSGRRHSLSLIGRQRAGGLKVKITSLAEKIKSFLRNLQKVRTTQGLKYELHHRASTQPFFSPVNTFGPHLELSLWMTHLLSQPKLRKPHLTPLC